MPLPIDVIRSLLICTQIAIISIGVEHPAYKKIAKRFADIARFVDCIQWLKRDPADGGVGHNEDGRHATTQQIVVSQKNFASLMNQELCEHLDGIGQGQLTIYVCRRGMHRANTCGHMSENIANEQVWEDTGGPMFNAKHFPITEYYGKNGSDSLIKHVEAWLEQPAVKNPIGRPLTLAERFSYSATSRDPKAIAELKDIHNFSTGEFRQLAIDKADEIKNKNTPRPWHEQSATGTVDVSDDEDKDKKWDASPEPEWADFEFDPRKWWHLLDRYEVDDTAREILFLLASSCEEGRWEAWQLVCQIYSDTEHTRFKNPSNFIHRCSLNCIQILQDKYPSITLPSSKAKSSHSDSYDNDKAWKKQRKW